MKVPGLWNQFVCAAVLALGFSTSAASETCLVNKVYSGTTIKVIYPDGKKERVRYIGIDSPSKGKPFYDLCVSANKALVENKNITLTTDVALVAPDEKKLCYVYQDAVFVNAELIKNGYALAHILPPNERYRELFIGLQKEARTHRRGLWAYEDHNDEPYYVGSRSDKVFHRPSCSHVKNIPFHDRIIFRTRDDCLNEGYTQDWRCCPLFVKPFESKP
ncbi:MAG: thermonuclease family protein [Desulfobacterota bacterium]|nr:thermonuclease family protein [Thermodesulfobacteriota bacterium]